MSTWLVKSESNCYSIEDLKRDGKTAWEGVRNYQARNNLMAMRVGERVLFYHSTVPPLGIVGVGKVSKLAFVDKLQFDKESEYYDAAATKEKPRWFCPEIAFVLQFSKVLPLEQLKKDKKLSGMVLLQKGSRLSVQAVSEKHFKYILSFAK